MKQRILTLFAALMIVASSATLVLSQSTSEATSPEAVGAVVTASTPETTLTMPEVASTAPAPSESVTGATTAESAVTELELPLESSAPSLFMEIVDAFRGGDYALAVFLFVVLATWGLRKLAGVTDKLKFFASRLGGYILVFANTAALALATARAAGASINFQLVSTTIILAFAAIGGWQTVKDYLDNRKAKRA